MNSVIPCLKPVFMAVSPSQLISLRSTLGFVSSDIIPVETYASTTPSYRCASRFWSSVIAGVDCIPHVVTLCILAHRWLT